MSPDLSDGVDAEVGRRHADDNGDDGIEFRRGSLRESSGCFRENYDGAAATLRRGRGVVMATRGGRPVLLDTHPIHAPPSPSPLQPLELPPPTHAAVTRPLGGTADHGKVNAVSSSGTDDVTAGKRRRKEGDGSVSSPTIDDAFKGSTTTTAFKNRNASSLGVSEGGGPAAGRRQAGVVEVAPTLGMMCKRGFLVRAMRRFSSLSVVGVRFAKAATWCSNCGLVSGKSVFLLPPPPRAAS